MLIRFVLFGLLGLLCTLAFTAVSGSISKKNWDFQGQASLILFPAFGLIAILYPPIAIHLGSIPWYGRGATYMVAFFIAQYATGWLLTRLGICPWNYPKGGSIGGLIRVTDAPVWFGAGLGVEWIYPYIKIVANAVG